jgi:hypothetical protein
MTYGEGQLLNLFICSVPLWIPAAIGLYLYVNRPDDLGKMATYLTLKPIVTTPIWFAIIYTLLPPFIHKLEPAHFLTLLPGAGLTIVIVFMYRHLFRGPSAGSAIILLVLDCIRWLNSFLLILPYGGGTNGPLNCLFAFIGLAMPSAVAVAALALTLSRTVVEE